MFKKLLALAAVAAVGFSAKAETVVDYTIDYTQTQWGFYVMGYKPNCDAGWLTVTQPFGSIGDDGEFKPSVDEDGNPAAVWYQCFVADGIKTEVGTSYTVTVYGKADAEASAALNMGWGWGDGQQLGNTINFTTEWQEIEVPYAEVGGASCNLVFQPGTQLTTFEIKWIKVSHVVGGGSSRPEVWIDCLENGDAEGEYGKVPCCYTKEYGYNNNEPHPALIETIDGNNVFVCHAVAVPDEDFADNPDAVAWQNQIWIQSPQAWSTGQQFRLSFRYKASRANKTNTQGHKQNPGDYLIWHCIGDIMFTTEWQEFSQVVTVERDMDGMWSVAFNLGPDEEYKYDTDFYLDDLKWEYLELEDGWFVAGDFNDWDYGNAVELYYDDDFVEYIGVIGSDTPASEVMVSTKRGSDSAFKNNTIKPKEDILDGEYVDYATGYKKIALPEAGKWEVHVDVDHAEICFSLLSAGIEGVSVENAPAVYYNLQGVKVLNPANGNIYIVKRGNKVSKEIVR